MSTQQQCVTRTTDMSQDMQKEVIEYSRRAIDQGKTIKFIASYIKNECKNNYNGTWHCIVGRNFGSFVTHELKHYIYLYIGQIAILIFKTS